MTIREGIYDEGEGENKGREKNDGGVGVMGSGMCFKKWNCGLFLKGIER